MASHDVDHDESVLLEEEAEVEEPALYRVLLHNDNFTTMEFVVYVLIHVFHRSEEDAIRLMLQVHNAGIGVAGIFTFEVAEMKVEQTSQLARAHEFPLLCTMERA